MKAYLITAAISALVGAAGVWKFLPPKVAEPIVIRVPAPVATQTKTRWRTRVITKKDGTTITDCSGEGTGATEIGSGPSVSVPVASRAEPPRWSVSALGGVRLLDLKPVGGAHVQYRLVGPLQVGAWGLGGPGLAAGGVSLGVTF